MKQKTFCISVLPYTCKSIMITGNEGHRTYTLCLMTIASRDIYLCEWMIRVWLTVCVDPLRRSRIWAWATTRSTRKATWSLARLSVRSMYLTVMCLYGRVLYWHVVPRPCRPLYGSIRTHKRHFKFNLTHWHYGRQHFCHRCYTWIF